MSQTLLQFCVLSCILCTCNCLFQTKIAEFEFNSGLENENDSDFNIYGIETFFQERDEMHFKIEIEK